MAYVTHEAALDRPSGGGESVRAHLEASGSAFARERLTAVAFPDAMGYLYAWWLDVAAGRGEGMNGPAPITWEGLDAWARQTGVVLAPHEARGLLALDAVWRMALRDDTPSAGQPEAVARPRSAWPTKKPEIAS